MQSGLAVLAALRMASQHLSRALRLYARSSAFDSLSSPGKSFPVSCL